MRLEIEHTVWLVLELKKKESRITNDASLPLGDVLLDPLEDGRLCVQIVHGNVEEALDLRGVQVHRDDVVGAGHGEHIGHQLGADRGSRLQKV